MSLVNGLVPRRVSTLFSGWWVVLSGAVLLLLNGWLLNQAFGAYFVHWREEFGWSRKLLSGSYSMTQVENGLLGPLQGWLIDRFGSRAVIRAGLVLFALGLMLLSFAQNVLQFYGAFFVIAVGSTLAGWITINVAVANWFYRRRGAAMGLVSAGQAIGGLLIPVLALSLTAFGWRVTAFGSGVLVLLVGLPVTQWMRDRPEDLGLVPDGTSPAAPRVGVAGRAAPAGSVSSSDFTLREALRASSFWLISLGHAFAVLVVSAVNVFLIPHLVERLGMSVELASTMLAIMTVLTLVGQVAGGLVADRMDKRVLAAISMGGHALGMLALAFATSLAWVLAFAVLHGLAWGVRGPLMSAIRADYFGRRHLGLIMGFSSMVVVLGTVTGPLLAGALADRTGNYQLGFAILAVLAGAGTLFFVLARRPSPPRRGEVQPTPTAAGPRP
ncbi:MAG: MFS transporter [Chloroflexi bacterium]|nr:MFS transporter [Chloroflexota bacterium]